ncbi:hypothetical protein BDV35DRAFT_374217 [Aspergillus flavus]|uniref:Uncharacterized protein n=1 Tax=Aspergillus flavus TaxID=5059 RepID=A0A5N6GIC6_ASPFL|nr:hypothetical protein BDV35DRAFT_374217 [Aspergillus flavus]
MVRAAKESTSSDPSFFFLFSELTLLILSIPPIFVSFQFDFCVHIFDIRPPPASRQFICPSVVKHIVIAKSSYSTASHAATEFAQR